MLVGKVYRGTLSKEQLHCAHAAAHRRRHQHCHLAAARRACVDLAAAREPLGHRFGRQITTQPAARGVPKWGSMVVA
jgi:hypothetical protein